MLKHQQLFQKGPSDVPYSLAMVSQRLSWTGLLWHSELPRFRIEDRKLWDILLANDLCNNALPETNYSRQWVIESSTALLKNERFQSGAGNRLWVPETSAWRFRLHSRSTRHREDVLASKNPDYLPVPPKFRDWQASPGTQHRIVEQRGR